MESLGWLLDLGRESKRCFKANASLSLISKNFVVTNKMVRCSQITLKKRRCKNKVKADGMCWLHLKIKGTLNAIERFITAQAAHYDTAKSELKTGQKQSHWIWFIFPQLKGLGKSAMSDKYGIKDHKEAKEYMDTPILRSRYLELVDITYDWLVKKNLDPYRYVGADVVKLKSSLELFQPILKSKKIAAILHRL